MKNLLILIFILLGGFAYSQNIDSLKTELIKTYKIKILEQDSVIMALDSQVIALNAVISKQDLIIKSDSLTFKLYDTQVQLLERNIELYDKHLQKTKPKFWESRPFNFIMGAGSVLLSSWVVKNVIN